MQTEAICLPGEPPICVALSHELRSTRANGVFVEDDEPLLASAELLASLKASDPPGCLLCLFEEIGEED